jgi:hypothetical protein
MINGSRISSPARWKKILAAVTTTHPISQMMPITIRIARNPVNKVIPKIIIFILFLFPDLPGKSFFPACARKRLSIFFIPILPQFPPDNLTLL